MRDKFHALPSPDRALFTQMGHNSNQQGKNTSSKTGSRLRAIAERLHDGNKSDLARSLGMKPNSFSKYTSGRRRPGAVVLEKLSRMGVNVNWLLTGSGSMFQEGGPGSPDQLPIANPTQELPTMSPRDSEVFDDELHPIPLVHIEGSGENLRLVETGRSEWVSTSYVEKEYGLHPERLRDFHATGDAMVDTIQPGDRLRLALCSRGLPGDGTIVLLRGPVSFLLRRVRLEGHTVALVADNPDIETQHVDLDQWKDEYESVGQVLEVRRAV